MLPGYPAGEVARLPRHPDYRNPSPRGDPLLTIPSDEPSGMESRLRSHGLAGRGRQELDVPGRDVVHRGDDCDPTVPDELSEGLALLDELLDDVRDMATGHRIDE